MLQLIKNLLNWKKDSFKTPPRKSDIIQTTFRVYLDEGNIRVSVITEWKPSGLARMPEFIFSLLSGGFNSQILNSVEQHNSTESQQIIDKVESMYDALKSKINEGSDEILPSQAYSPDDYDDSEGFI